MTTRSGTRILVLGAGGIGGYFGGRLAAGGADVTFLVRSARAAQLRQRGLVIHSAIGDLRLDVRTVGCVSGFYDLILLACKAPDLDRAIEAILPAAGPHTAVVPLLNGLRHLPLLDERLPQAQILGGLCHIGATLEDNGDIRHLNDLQHLALGSRRTEQKATSEKAHAALSGGGLAPALSQDIMQEMWEKFVFLTSYAGLTCLLRAPIGAIASTGEGKAIANEMLAECAMIATASGFPPRSEFMASSLRTLTDENSGGTSSMLRDVLRGNQSEQEHVLGDMFNRAVSMEINAPILRLARTQMQAYEIVRSGSHHARGKR